MLVITLWLVVTLAIAAVALGNYLGTETRLMRYHLARAQAKAWARAGVYVAMQRLALDAKEDALDWLGDDWAVVPAAQSAVGDPTAWVVPMPAESGGASRFTGDATIHITDEERRLDLSVADKAMLTNLLGNQDAAEAILNYQKPGASTDTSIQPPYVPKGAPVTALEELWEIPAVAADPHAKQLLAQDASVGTQGTFNINTVRGEVLKAVAHQDPELEALIDPLISNRPGADGAFGTTDDCTATEITQAANELAACQTPLDPVKLASLLSLATFSVSSSLFRVRVVGRVQIPSVQYQVEAIVQRSGSVVPPSGGGTPLPFAEQTFRVLTWKEG